MASRDEILKFVVKTEGKQSVDAMGASFDALGDAAKNADPKAEALIDDIERLTNTGNAVAGFVKLKAQLQETGDNLFIARQRTKELEAQFNTTLEPTAKLTKQLERARAEVARLATEQNRQTAGLQRAENTIKAAGYDLNQLARAEADVRDKTVQATAAARAYAAELAQTGKVATATGGTFSRLRALAAGVFAGLSIRGAAEGIKNIALLGDQAERTRNQFTQLYGSQAAGEKAVAGLTKFANQNGQALDATRESAVKLKAFGIDPLAGSLQSLVDENAAMGGSQERLEGTILAVGQAWAKQKLQGEEILQLVERGVPVWDLLSKVTGKNVGELQKLSEAGKLGRKEISALLAEIGKMNSGAAAKNAGTLSGLFTQLSSRVRTFFTDVSNKGPLDFFKTQLRDAITLVDRLASSTELEAWARKIGSAVVSVSQTVVAGGKFVVQYADTLLFLAKAYAAVKVGNFITDVAGVAAGAANAGKGVTSLAGAFKLLPGSVQIAIALIGLDLAVKGATELGDAIGRNLPATREWEERTKALNAETRAAAERYREATSTLDQYRNVQIKTGDVVATLTAAEQARYGQGLAGLQQYLAAQVKYYDSLRGIGQLNDEGLQHLAALRARLAEVEAGIKTLDSTTAVAADTMKAKLSESARLLVRDLEAAGNSSKKVGDLLQKAFTSIDTDSVTKVGDIGLALAVVARESDAAGKAVNSGLAASLRQLTGEDLLKFQSASMAAFASVNLDVKDTAAILDATLLVGMEKLGVAPEKFGMGMTAAGKQAVAAFTAILENARATGEQIEAAFTAAIRSASSTQDIEAFGVAIELAATQGRISLEGAERAGYALQARVREIAAVTDPLADAFARLGIKSQASLNATRDSARDAFRAIAAGSNSVYDVQRAFDAYAQTARDAVAGANRYIRDQVEAQLQAEAAAVNVKLALVDMGAAGETAGKRTAAGANEATAALDETAGAAERAASKADDLGESSNNAATGLQNVAASANDASESAIGASAAFADMAQNFNGRFDRVTFNLLQEETRQAEVLLETLRAQNAERSNGIDLVRAQFRLIDDSLAQQIAREQELAQQRRDRQAEDLQRAREQQSNTTTNSGGSSSGGISRPGTLVVDLKASRVDAEQLLGDGAAMDRLAREMARRLKDLAGKGGFSLK